MISEANLLSAIAKLRMHSKARGQRSPHKPFLLLIALARLKQGKERLMLFSDIEKRLDELLTEFCPPRGETRPNEPFCRLRGDGIWELSAQANTPLPQLLTKQQLKTQEVKGGFSPDVYKLLKSSPQLIDKVAICLLNLHFPETAHQDILDIIDLDIGCADTEEIAQRRLRNSEFRKKILQIYQYRCAVCSFDVRLGLHPLALEAAHIKWVSGGGVDVESNGLALCALHHKLFDRGAFSIGQSDIIIVSDKIVGYAGLKEWLLNFHNKTLNTPNHAQYRPKAEYKQWHRDQVFRGREDI